VERAQSARCRAPAAVPLGPARRVPARSIARPGGKRLRSIALASSIPSSLSSPCRARWKTRHDLGRTVLERAAAATALSRARGARRRSRRQHAPRALFFDGQACRRRGRVERTLALEESRRSLRRRLARLRRPGARSRRHPRAARRRDLCPLLLAERRCVPISKPSRRPAATHDTARAAQAPHGAGALTCFCANRRITVRRCMTKADIESPARRPGLEHPLLRPGSYAFRFRRPPGRGLPVLLAAARGWSGDGSPRCRRRADGYVFVPAGRFSSKPRARGGPARLSAHRPAPRVATPPTSSRPSHLRDWISSSRPAREERSAHADRRELAMPALRRVDGTWELVLPRPPRYRARLGEPIATRAALAQRPDWPHAVAAVSLTTRRRTPPARRHRALPGRLCTSTSGARRPRRRRPHLPWEWCGLMTATMTDLRPPPAGLWPDESRRTRVAQPLRVDDLSRNVWEWCARSRSPTKSSIAAQLYQGDLSALRQPQIASAPPSPFHGVRSARLPWMHADHSC